MLKGTLDFFNLIYPVGSVYTTFDGSFNPNTSFGGTWQKLNDTFLYATNTTSQVGVTGGEATHTLTIQEMPQHSHDIYYAKPYTEDTYGNSYVYGQRDNKNRLMIEPEGGSQPHNNMPPYTKVIMWRRTA